MTTTAVRPAAPTRTRRDWWIPASLLALTFVPAAAGAARLVDLSSRPHRGERPLLRPAGADHRPHPRRDDVLRAGAFQFMPSLRRRRPRWHRWSGRVLVPAGLAAALSGMWMAAFADLPVHDNTALMWFRLALRLDHGGRPGARPASRSGAATSRTHQRWMARCVRRRARAPARRRWSSARWSSSSDQPGGTLKATRDGVRVGAQPGRGRVAGAPVTGPPVASVEPTGLIGPERELDPVAGAELRHQRAEVGLHRAQRDVELGGHLVVGEAPGDGDQHLLLPVGQR